MYPSIPLSWSTDWSSPHPLKYPVLSSNTNCHTKDELCVYSVHAPVDLALLNNFYSYVLYSPLNLGTFCIGLLWVVLKFESKPSGIGKYLSWNIALILSPACPCTMIKFPYSSAIDTKLNIDRTVVDSTSATSPGRSVGCTC